MYEFEIPKCMYIVPQTSVALGVLVASVEDPGLGQNLCAGSGLCGPPWSPVVSHGLPWPLVVSRGIPFLLLNQVCWFVWFLFASVQYFLGTEIQEFAPAAAKFWILNFASLQYFLSTNNSAGNHYFMIY